MGIMINLTDQIIVFSVLLLIAYDIFALAKGGVDSTISKRIIIWSHEYPAIPFLFGALMGHFFWQL